MRAYQAGEALLQLVNAVFVGDGPDPSQEYAELLGDEAALTAPAGQRAAGGDEAARGCRPLLLRCDVLSLLVFLASALPPRSGSEAALQTRLVGLVALAQALLRTCQPLRRTCYQTRADPRFEPSRNCPRDDPDEARALSELRRRVARAAGVGCADGPLDESAMREVSLTLEIFGFAAALVEDATRACRKGGGSGPGGGDGERGGRDDATGASLVPLPLPRAHEVLESTAALTLLERWAGATGASALPPMQMLPPLQLHRMPSDFAALTAQLHERTCAACGVAPVEPALCLLTGMLFCSGTHCRRRREEGEPLEGLCTRHARQCGGVGIFYLVHQCTLLLIDGPHAAYYPSIYVDVHGEEDRGLRRGKPLFLSAARVAATHRLWLAHAVPQTVARARSAGTNVIRANFF